MKRAAAPRWSRSPERAELLALYAEVDELLEGWSCACSRAGVGETPEAQCCHFAVTGREPHPTAVERAEIEHALRAAGGAPRAERHERGGVRGRALPLAKEELGACPLLSPEGRCRIYASRPFGCRTFFCDHAQGPGGPRDKLPRDRINSVGRRIADLSARFDPRDPLPRPLTRALAQPLAQRR